MEFIKLLANMHLSNTMNNENKWVHKIDITGITLNMLEDRFSIYNIAWGNFVMLPLLKGTAHIYPQAFFRIVMEYVKQGIIDTKTEIEIPNGCCTKTDCPLNQWYDTIVQAILLNK